MSSFPSENQAPPMIAALWANFMFDMTGAVYYRVSNDPDTLNQVVSMITDLNPKLTGYSPTMAVIVTWFRSQEESNERVSSAYIIAYTYTPL